MAVISGEADMTFDSVGGSQKMADGGKLRALVLLNDKRTQGAPDVPSMIEADLPPVQAFVWTGVLAPAGLPEDVQEVLGREIAAALKTPELAARIKQDGAENASGTGQAFTERIQAEQTQWREVIRAKNLHID